MDEIFMGSNMDIYAWKLLEYLLEYYWNIAGK